MKAISPARLRRRVAAGARIGELARAFGVDPATVRRHCRLHGIPMPVAKPGPRRRSPPTEQIIARVEAGETVSSIARSAGVCHAAIVRALERDGYRIFGGRITRNPEVQS